MDKLKSQANNFLVTGLNSYKDCESALQHGIRTYVDEMYEAVSKTYTAMPTRLYLVWLDRRMVYAGGSGPFGFEPTELGKAIDVYLAQASGTPA